MQQFNINNAEVVELTNRLERLHKSAMPLAVRGTLNDAAFEAKKRVIPIFNKRFTTRKKNFIRTHTSVNKSINTFNINQMESSMGVIKGKSQAGDELYTQEFGGTVRNRVGIPIGSKYGGKARVSGNDSKVVSKRYYMQKLNSRKIAGTGNKFKNQAFIKAAFKGGKGTFLIFDKILYEIAKVKTNPLFIKANPLYSYQHGRSVQISKASFIAPAGKVAERNMNKTFSKNVDRQFKRILKK